MKILEYKIDENDQESGVYAISLVSSPAIESDFVALNDHKIELKVVDKEKGLLMGPALIPDKTIFRRDEKNGEYYIYFSKDTVRKASELFLKRGYQDRTTLEHEAPLQGNTVVESWIKEDETHDKSVLHGLDAPLGTWLVSVKVGDPKLLELAKDGVINGFSIEGMFTDSTELSEEEILVDEILELLNKTK